MRVGLRFSGRLYLSSVCARHLDVLKPLLAMNRAAIEIEMNVVVLDLYVRDMRGIARLDRRSPDRNRLLQFLATGRGDPIFQLQSLRAHWKSGSSIKNLHLEVADDLDACLFGHARSIGRNRGRGRLRMLGLSTSCWDG